MTYYIISLSLMYLKVYDGAVYSLNLGCLGFRDTNLTSETVPLCSLSLGHPIELLPVKPDKMYYCSILPEHTSLPTLHEDLL